GQDRGEGRGGVRGQVRAGHGGRVEKYRGLSGLSTARAVPARYGRDEGFVVGRRKAVACLNTRYPTLSLPPPANKFAEDPGSRREWGTRICSYKWHPDL